MQLNSFPINVISGRKVIHFNNHSLLTLESLLNSYITDVSSINSYIADLNYLKNNWGNLDTIVHEQYNDYWDEEILENFNVSGQWFTFGGSEYVIIYINKANQHIYIYDELLNDQPIVQMPLNEFIDILEQWRVIQAT